MFAPNIGEALAVSTFGGDVRVINIGAGNRVGAGKSACKYSLHPRLKESGKEVPAKRSPRHFVEL